MLPHILTAAIYRFLRWTLWTVAALVSITVLGFLYVTFVGVTIDASALRGPVAQVFANNLNREVRFDGAMQLEISGRPKLRVGGLHIANPAGFDEAEFASLGEARLSLDLLQLLQNRLRIEELAGRNVRIRLERRSDNRNNWSFNPPQSRPTQAQPSEIDRQMATIGPARVLALLDIQRVALEELNVEYVGPNGQSHYFDLHKLAAQAPAGQPFRLTLDGAVEKVFPYKLVLSGDALSNLPRADKPWPFDFKLTFLSTTLAIDGAISGATGEIRFRLGTENLLEFERLLQTRLPDVGATDVNGVFFYQPGKVSLKQLSGVMGATRFSGALDFDYSGPRPKVNGSLALPALDLRPFLVEKPDAKAAPPKSLADTYRELSKATFSLRQLNNADVDVTLQVGNWLSLPGEVQNATLQVKISDGRLQAPVQATVSGVTLAGNASADATSTPPKFSLELATRDSDLGGLAKLLAGLSGIKGRLGQLDLKLSAQGDQVSELTQSLDVRLAVGRAHLSYGNIEGGRPVEFSLERLAIALPSRQALTGELRGSLLGNPLIASLRGGKLETLMTEGRTPIEFNARSGSVRARLHGSLAQLTERDGPAIAFEVSAPRAGEVASWFGLRPGAEAAIALSGNARLRFNEWRLSEFKFQLGRTSVTADLAHDALGDRPLLNLKLIAQQIDVKELESLIPKPDGKKEEHATPALEIPILPRGIDLKDADITVQARRFVNSPLEVNDVSFDGHIRDGHMLPSKFSATVAAIAFGGALALDLRGTEPSATLWLAADNVDVGKLLRKLDLSRNIDATFGEVRLQLAARSSRLGDMIARSELLGAFGAGSITLRDPNTRGQANITVGSGILRAAAGAPISLDLTGALDSVPVAISLETARAQDLVNARLPVPFSFAAEAANTKVKLTGQISRPLGSDIDLALDMRGTRIDNLDSLVRASLPPWGPWSANGRFRWSERGYEVADLRLRVGTSELSGEGVLETAARPLRLRVSLDAPNIQLDDFRFGEWSPVEKKPAADEKALSAEEIRVRAARASDQAQSLLSPEVLKRQDAYLTVRVAQVLSGNDKLGSGSLNAKLVNGRAEIGPVEVSSPAGSAKLWLGYEPSERDVKVDLRIEAARFDYGILARRIKPATDVRGTFSLDVDVTSRARYLSDVFRHGNGSIAFAVWPENMKSGIFDLWAVNLLVALVPAVDSDKASKINCALGRFDLKNGKLNDRIILLDTTRMRVTGTGSADFSTEKLKLRMRPQAKTAQFLSLATPIEVAGPFTDFKIGVSPGDILETVGRLATSIVWVPLQKLFGKRIPADGRDVCAVTLGQLLDPAAYTPGSQSN